jgi:hypothetical protein
MSRFTPEMDRNGIQWQEPVGTWKQAQDIVHLATIAEKLIIPPNTEETDLLNSIPTPWSRLLLFENALYNERHPSHADVLDQWRGLLGLLALANPLRIRLEASAAEHIIDLSDFADVNLIAKTFLDLQPHYLQEKQNLESGKWDQFHLIVVGDQLLGATSPRTLVFTAIDHHCPPTIPFQNEHGKLSDPLAYFARYNDKKYLVLLKQWIDSILPGLRTNQALIDWLGTFPAAPKVAAKRRHQTLIALLQQWQAEITRAIPSGAPAVPSGQPVPAFTLAPYDTLRFLPDVPVSGDSDLLLATEAAGEKKVVVCFRPDRTQNPARNSALYNERGQMIQSDALLICDGRWTRADEPLPESLDFLPPDWLYISDPVAELFEDNVIEVELPEAGEDAGSVYTLSVGQKQFLFPFKKEILSYFTPAELFKLTTIEVEPDSGYRITLQIPLVKNRSIRATRRYESGANELVMVNNKAVDHRTSELAVWPRFASKVWNHYFYFKRRLAPKDQPGRLLDFTPIVHSVSRKDPDGTMDWYFSKQPVEAFVGSVRGHTGLLLPRYEELPAAGDKDYWNVSVDFGSTHTRVFYLRRLKNEDGSYSGWPSARIEQLEFSAYAKQLTTCDPLTLRNDFFALSGKLDPPTRVELKTLLMQPVNDSTKQADWRPREGFAFMQWINGGFDERRLKSDIKWESSGNRNDLNSYLRCLMVMVQAEAVRRNAEIIHVTRSYPTAFNNRLQAHHNLEWVALGAFMNLPVESKTTEILSEAVATARFLSGSNVPLSNMVSLDIGGSTTDIAIWYGKRVRTDRGDRMKSTLGIQESVKMAAGSVGKYLQSDPNNERFLKWFLEVTHNQGVLKDVTLSGFAGRQMGYALMFYDILSYYELAGDRLKNEYNALVGLIKTRDEARGLVVHLIYLFASLIYYAGVLARKVGLQEKNHPVYYLYFCGKGGTLITWIRNYQAFAEKLFIAGLYGPNPPATAIDRSKVKVEVKISPKPKEEVGRGLLEELASKEKAGEDASFGLVDPKQHSVTVGESGYRVRTKTGTKPLNWQDEVDETVLRNLDETLPSFEEMKELNCFVAAVREAFKHEQEGDTRLDFDKVLANAHEKKIYVDQLTTRLFGDAEGSVLRELERDDNPNALVEPLLITEMKVLLEVLSNNNGIFQ